MRTLRGAWRGMQDGAALAAILVVYWTTVFPIARKELARWRELASAIPDPRMRELALATLDEESGLAEGAAIFATLVRGRAARRRLVSLLVAWQVLYDCLDTVGEQPAAEGALYSVLATALQPAPAGAVRADEDVAYLDRLVACCRARVATLPSIDVVGPFAVRAAGRCAEGQALTHAVASDGDERLRRWALAQPRTDGLLWWEVAAGAISSLAVHALLAMAALPHATARQAAQVDAAYFPSICALSTLLDSTIDAAADAGTANYRCTTYYADATEAFDRLEVVTRIAASAARGLPQGRGHAVILAGMTAYYAASGWAGNERAHRRVATAVGGSAAPILWTLRIRARLSGGATPAVSVVGEPNEDGGRARRSR